MNRSLLLFLFLALAAPTFAQSTAHVLVTVTGDLGKLSKDTISVSIDGTPATVSGLSPVPAGSSKFVLLIDVSASNKDKVQFETTSALKLYEQLLNAGYIGYFGDFNEEFYLDRKTNTVEAAKREIQQSPFRGGSALYDAVQEAAPFLARQSQPGDALSIIVITDGEDNASRENAASVLKDLQKQGTALHEVILLGPNSNKKRVSEFSTLSEQTGGTTTVLNEPKDFEKPIVQAFASQYWVTLQAQIPHDKSLHSIQFSTTAASTKLHGPDKIALH